MKRALLSPVAIGLTLLTFLALIGCAKAGIWQYHRGVIRHDANAQVKSNISLAPISETEFSELTKNLRRCRQTNGAASRSPDLFRPNMNYFCEIVTKMENMVSA